MPHRLDPHSRKFSRREKLTAMIDRFRSRRAAGKVVNPILGYPVTYAYGVPSLAYEAGYHTGEDHSTNHLTGIPVYAVGPAHVVEIDDNGGTWGPAYGSVVVCETLNHEFRYGYCHLSGVRPDLAIGAHVQAGEELAYSGNSGNSSGPHVHFEARKPPFRYGDDVHPIRVKQRLDNDQET